MPGEPVNCRCSAAMSVEGLLDELEAEGQPDDRSASETETPDFDFQNYQPPKNTKEAQDFLKENNIALNADLKGISASSLEEPLRAMQESKERFDLKRMLGVGPIGRMYPSRSSPRGANAAIWPIHASDTTAGHLHLPTTFGAKKKSEQAAALAAKTSAMYQRRKQAMLAAKKKSGDLDSRVASRIDRVESTKYGWSQSSLAPAADQATVTTYHEMGHVLHLLHEDMKGKIDSFLQKERPIKSGWSLLVSEYSAANGKEYVAESFAIYMTQPKSQHFRIHPGLLKIFRDRDRMK